MQSNIGANAECKQHNTYRKSVFVQIAQYNPGRQHVDGRAPVAVEDLQVRYMNYGLVHYTNYVLRCILL